MGVSITVLTGLRVSGLAGNVSEVTGPATEESARRLESVVVCAPARNTWNKIKKSSAARFVKGSIVTFKIPDSPATREIVPTTAKIVIQRGLIKKSLRSRDESLPD